MKVAPVSERHVIHAIIKGLGDDNDAVQSTRLPYGGDAGIKQTTTEHVSVHEVTTHSEDKYISTAPAHWSRNQPKSHSQ
ncbi:uncharacterized protein LOC131845357 [Achroia grisella]|uniref:uncharacterized protein LOC131845357 n=1 Tax=Achroia grisella TaxID=688607 RepID=UPI0027D22556|nr:uncharacterized protein LOC131845357 [Achroia grisella]